jgi:hypothetical protein
MDKNQSNTGQNQVAVPQMRLRTNLRGGASVDSCLANLETWKNNYYKHYNSVNTTKPTPCNNL